VALASASALFRASSSAFFKASASALAFTFAFLSCWSF